MFAMLLNATKECIMMYKNCRHHYGISHLQLLSVLVDIKNARHHLKWLLYFVKSFFPSFSVTSIWSLVIKITK